LRLRDEDVLTQLAAHGVEYVVIDRGGPVARALRRFVADHDAARLVCADEVLVLYRLEAPERPSVKGKTNLPIAGLYANVNGNVVESVRDNDLATRWDTGPQQPGMMLEVDLGSPREVSTIELSLGQFIMDFPRGLRIEASDDRVAWREIWRGSSAGRAVVGALRSRTGNPLTYDLAAVRTRYLRLWLTGKDDVYYWSVAELKVFGP
jgi:hypothetical protein